MFPLENCPVNSAFRIALLSAVLLAGVTLLLTASVALGVSGEGTYFHLPLEVLGIPAVLLGFIGIVQTVIRR